MTALGPAYIKFGQILSTRPDVVGLELAEQLRVLQDRLPPFPLAVARAEVEREIGMPIDQAFSEFSEPVAAASIAQVHRARLADTGQDVAVKVLRPGIERAFRKDIDAFYFAARMIETPRALFRRLRPRDVIAHFEGVVLGELDLRLEGLCRVGVRHQRPRTTPGFGCRTVLWHLSSRRVMTLGWAEGIRLGECRAIRRRGPRLRRIGCRAGAAAVSQPCAARRLFSC